MQDQNLQRNIASVDEEAKQFLIDEEAKQFLVDEEQPETAISEGGPSLGGVFKAAGEAVLEPALRTTRAGIKGATLGLSEPFWFKPLEEAQLALKWAYDNKKWPETEEEIQNYRNFIAQGQIAQKKFEQESPYISGAAEFAGAMFPGKTPATIISKIGIPATQQALTALQAATAGIKGGIVGGGIYSAAEEASRIGIPGEFGERSLQEQAKNIAISAGTTAALGGAITPAITKGIETAGRIGSSPTAQKIISSVFRIPEQTQQKYILLQKDIEALPDRQSIIEAFDGLRNKIFGMAEESTEGLNAAKEAAQNAERAVNAAQKKVARNLRDQLEEERKKLAETIIVLEKKAAEQKGKVREVEETIKASTFGVEQAKAEKLAEEAKFATSMMKEEAQTAAQLARQRVTQEAKEAVPSPGSIVPEIESAKDRIQKLIWEKSKEARASLSDDIFLDRRVIENAYDDAIESVKKGGQFLTKDVNLIRHLIDEKKNLIANNPERMLGEKFKNILSSLQEVYPTVAKTRFGTKAEQVYKQIYGKVNDSLTKAFDEYDQKMIPVREMTSWFEKTALSELSTPSKIETAIRQAVLQKNPRYQEFFEKMRQYLSDAGELEGLPFYRQFQEAVESASPTVLENKIKLLPEVKEYDRVLTMLKTQAFDPKARAELEAKLPIVRKAAEEAELALRAKNPTTIRELARRTPEGRELERLESLVELSRTRAFESTVFQTLGADPDAIKIVQLRKMIGELLNPQVVGDRVVKETIEATGNLGLAVAKKEEAQAIADLWLSRKKPIRAKERGESIVNVLLKRPDGVMTDEGYRILDMLGRLPAEEFDEFFSAFGVTNPKKFEQIVDALRVRASLEMPRVAGSRSVKLWVETFDRLSEAAGTSSGLSTKVYKGALSAIGAVVPLFGAAADTVGGTIIRTWLKQMVNMRGIMSYEKMMRTLPYSNKASVQISDYVLSKAEEVDENSLNEVDISVVPFVEHDIKTSDLRPLDKAKAMNQIQNGFIQGDLLRKLMLSGLKPRSETDSFGSNVRFAESRFAR